MTVYPPEEFELHHSHSGSSLSCVKSPELELSVMQDTVELDDEAGLGCCWGFFLPLTFSLKNESHRILPLGPSQILPSLKE